MFSFRMRYQIGSHSFVGSKSRQWNNPGGGRVGDDGSFLCRLLDGTIMTGLAMVVLDRPRAKTNHQ